MKSKIIAIIKKYRAESESRFNHLVIIPEAIYR